MNFPSSEEIEVLIGVQLDSDSFKTLIARLGQPLVEKFDDERTYLSFPEMGLTLDLEHTRVAAIFIYGDNVTESYEKYRGNLPFGLTFNDSKDTVQKKMGTPSKSHNGYDDGRSLARVYPWVKYGFGNYDLHIEFSFDLTEIRLLTYLSTP